MFCGDRWQRPPRWPSGKASTSRGTDLGSNPAILTRLFQGRVIPGTSKRILSGYPARRLAPSDQHCDWLARCPNAVSGRGGRSDLQLQSQCGSTYTCLSRCVPEIHRHAAGALRHQSTNRHTAGEAPGQGLSGLSCSALYNGNDNSCCWLVASRP